MLLSVFCAMRERLGVLFGETIRVDFFSWSFLLLYGVGASLLGLITQLTRPCSRFILTSRIILFTRISQN